MENTVTNRQMALIFFVTLVPLSSVNIAKLVAQYAGTGGWATIMLTSVLFAAAAWIWTKLNGMYPGKMLLDYGADIVGKVLAFVLGLCFILYFLTVLISLLILMSSLLKANFLPETPGWVTVLAAVPVIGFVAYKGVTNVARLIEIYGVILALLAVTIHAIMLIQGNVTRILPLYNPAETGRVISSVWNVVYPFLGVEVLSAIPMTQKFNKHSGKTAVLALLGIGLFYSLVTETSIMMIGPNEIVHYNYPLVVAIRLVELPRLKVFQRLDVIYLTVGFMGIIAMISVIYLSAVEFICRMLPKARRIFIVAAVGAISFTAYCFLQAVAQIDQTIVGIVSLAGVFVAGIVPLALLVIAKVKNHGKKTLA